MVPIEFAAKYSRRLHRPYSFFSLIAKGIKCRAKAFTSNPAPLRSKKHNKTIHFLIQTKIFRHLYFQSIPAAKRHRGVIRQPAARRCRRRRPALGLARQRFSWRGGPHSAALVPRYALEPRGSYMAVMNFHSSPVARRLNLFFFHARELKDVEYYI